MKFLIAGVIVFLLNAESFAQTKVTDTIPKTTGNSKKPEQPDAYQLDYKDVYENMHYNQPLRPQVHYTPISGQIADATGLVRYKGKYHLFYMFDEWSKQRRDNKNWGHATSDDCIYWEQQPHITNSVIDNRPGSGSGLVDWNNSLGLRSGVEKKVPVIQMYSGTNQISRGVWLFMSNQGFHFTNQQTWSIGNSSAKWMGSMSVRTSWK